jgi:hypothetical protein
MVSPPAIATRLKIGRFATMAVAPKSPDTSDLPKVVRARHPKDIARERARRAVLAMPPPSVVREAAIPPPASGTAATAKEIAEALRFAGDAKRPANCMMAQIAAERIILHLEKKGLTLVARDKKPPKR